MKQIRDRVAGLDVHRDNVVACCRVQEPDGQIEVRKRSFPTTRKGLAELTAFLTGSRPRPCPVEGTGKGLQN